MTLDEQRDMMERALGERMLNHAFIILHQWLKEVGVALYSDRLQSLEQNYKALFQYFLTANDPDRDHVLDDLTHATYLLVDEVYADICIKRGRHPQMIGFNGENPQSVINYFGACVRLRDEDLEWIRQITVEQPKPATALLAMAAMLHVLKDCFSEDAILCLMDACQSDNRLIADQALATTIILLAHYDVRIDFFPKIQNQFTEQLAGEEHTIDTLCSMVRATRYKFKDVLKDCALENEDLADTLREMLGDEASEDELDHVVSWIPEDENDYMTGLISILPNTWVMQTIVGEDEERMQMVSKSYLVAGYMELWWDNVDGAEQILVELLRTERSFPQDYINYGHICFLRGDKLMAFENYREAHRLFGSTKRFLQFFRPDRRFLVDRGVPMEDVYLMEDQLLRE